MFLISIYQVRILRLLALTKKHQYLIVVAYSLCQSSKAEGLNSKIQIIRKMAYGLGTEYVLKKPFTSDVESYKFIRLPPEYPDEHKYNLSTSPHLTVQKEKAI
jgi:hypothetical protein